MRYPTDPPKVEEIIAVMRIAGDGAHGRRLRGLIVIMWRAGLRIQEALALTEGDLDQRSGLDLVPGADFRGAGSRYRSEAQARAPYRVVQSGVATGPFRSRSTREWQRRQAE